MEKYDAAWNPRWKTGLKYLKYVAKREVLGEMTRMPSKFFLLVVFLIVFLFFEAGPDPAHAQTAPRPQAFLPETHFEFPPVFEGQTVLHAFVIQNRGTTPLDIMNVKTG